MCSLGNVTPWVGDDLSLWKWSQQKAYCELPWKWRIHTHRTEFKWCWVEGPLRNSAKLPALWNPLERPRFKKCRPAKTVWLFLMQTGSPLDFSQKHIPAATPKANPCVLKSLNSARWRLVIAIIFVFCGGGRHASELRFIIFQQLQCSDATLMIFRPCQCCFFKKPSLNEAIIHKSHAPRVRVLHASVKSNSSWGVSLFPFIVKSYPECWFFYTQCGNW